MYYKVVIRAVDFYSAVKYATIVGTIVGTLDKPLLVVLVNAFALSNTTTIFDAYSNIVDLITCYIIGSASYSTTTIIIAPYPFIVSIRGEKQLVCVLLLYLKA